MRIVFILSESYRKFAAMSSLRSLKQRYNHVEETEVNDHRFNNKSASDKNLSRSHVTNLSSLLQQDHYSTKIQKFSSFAETSRLVSKTITM